MNLRFFNQLFLQRYTPPFRHDLPSLVMEMLENEPRQRRYAKNLKLIKNWLWLKLSGQWSLLKNHLPPPTARVLWIHHSSRNIGDAIMELSGRTLLSNYQLDLFANRPYAELFQNDRFIKNVFTEPESVNPGQYDFVLLDIFNTRSIQLKRRLCPDLPYCCLQGFFYGANFNRILFNCYRIHHLLGYPYDDEALSQFLRPWLFVDDVPPVLPPKQRSKRVALMLGGRETLKTYRHWHEVIRILREKWPAAVEFPEFVLIGSQNGLEFVEPVTSALNDCKVIQVSKVGALSLRQTVRALLESDFFIGVDGALMHSANALDLPGVVLFGKFLPKFYLPPKSRMRAIRDPINVNNISSETIAEDIRVHFQQCCEVS